MINLQRKQIDDALPRVKNGLEKYLWLQSEVNKRDVGVDREFQRKFNAFYRVRRNQDWQKKFYRLLETNKKRNDSFGSVLIELYKKIGRMEASFISKLIATTNPEMPVIDRVVFKNLGLSLPSASVKNRDVVIKKQYQALTKEFSQFLQTENGKYLVNQFIKEYPKAKITKVKMLDFVLWQTRG